MKSLHLTLIAGLVSTTFCTAAFAAPNNGKRTAQPQASRPAPTRTPTYASRPVPTPVKSTPVAKTPTPTRSTTPFVNRGPVNSGATPPRPLGPTVKTPVGPITKAPVGPTTKTPVGPAKKSGPTITIKNSSTTNINQNTTTVIKNSSTTRINNGPVINNSTTIVRGGRGPIGFVPLALPPVVVDSPVVGTTCPPVCTTPEADDGVVTSPSPELIAEQQRLLEEIARLEEAARSRDSERQGLEAELESLRRLAAETAERLRNLENGPASEEPSEVEQPAAPVKVKK